MCVQKIPTLFPRLWVPNWPLTIRVGTRGNCYPEEKQISPWKKIPLCCYTNTDMIYPEQSVALLLSTFHRHGAELEKGQRKNRDEQGTETFLSAEPLCSNSLARQMTAKAEQAQRRQWNNWSPPFLTREQGEITRQTQSKPKGRISPYNTSFSWRTRDWNTTSIPNKTEEIFHATRKTHHNILHYERTKGDLSACFCQPWRAEFTSSSKRANTPYSMSCHFTVTWKGTQSHIYWNRVLNFIFSFFFSLVSSKCIKNTALESAEL